LVGIGFVSIHNRLGSIHERMAFLAEFADRFSRYVQSGGQDDSLYVELTQRIVRMQREVGNHGVVAHYRPPFASVSYNSYPVLLNMLPEYQRSANDWALRSQAVQYANGVRDVLLRYSGSLGEAEADLLKDLHNPLAWFRDGVRIVLASPFDLLRSFGVLSSSAAFAITGSDILRVAAGIVALITLGAAIVQILSGWEASSALVQKVLHL
jgi:hypothetical protein